MTHTALHYRKNHSSLFLHGTYCPVEAQGERAEHVCGFLRQDDHNACLAVFPRFVTHLIPDPAVLPVGESVWGKTRISLPSSLRSQSFRNVFTQEIVAPQTESDMLELPMATLFSHYPFALLEPLS